jgi:hypothetical protein
VSGGSNGSGIIIIGGIVSGKISSNNGLGCANGGSTNGSNNN